MTKKTFARIGLAFSFAFLAGYSWWSAYWIVTTTPLDLQSVVNEIAHREDEVFFLSRRDSHQPLVLPFVRFSPYSRIYPFIKLKESRQQSTPEFMLVKRVAEMEKFGSEFSFEQWQKQLTLYEQIFERYRQERLFQTDLIQNTEAQQSHMLILKDKVSKSVRLSHSQREELLERIAYISSRSKALHPDISATNSALFDLDQLHRDHEFGEYKIMGDHDAIVLSSSLSILEIEGESIVEKKEQFSPQGFVINPSTRYLRLESSPSSHLAWAPPLLRIQRTKSSNRSELVFKTNSLFLQKFAVTDFSQRDFSLLRRSLPYVWQLQQSIPGTEIAAVFLPGKIATSFVRILSALLIITGLYFFVHGTILQKLGRIPLKEWSWAHTFRNLPYQSLRLAVFLGMAGLAGLLLLLNFSFRSPIHLLIFVSLIGMALVYQRFKALSLLLVPFLFSVYVLCKIFFPWIESSPVLLGVILMWMSVLITELLERQFVPSRRFTPHKLREDVRSLLQDAQYLLELIGRSRLLAALLFLFVIIQSYLIVDHVSFVIEWLREGTVWFLLRSLVWIAALILVDLMLIMFLIWKRKNIQLSQVLFLIFLSIFMAMQLINFSKHNLENSPLILDVSPDTASIWEEVHIRGRNFFDLPFDGKVLLNGKEQRVLRWNDTRVIFIIDPNTSTSGDIQLVRYDGVMINAGYVTVGER